MPPIDSGGDHRCMVVFSAIEAAQFGRRVTNIDLRHPLAAAQLGELQQELDEHGVLVFPF